MANTKSVPEFGLLSGLTVVCHGEGVAAPFGASLMAENGATVILVESATEPDILRSYDDWGYAWSQERRNMLDLAIDIETEEGKEVLKKLAKEADILIESLGGGRYEELGLSDEVLWEQNPLLCVVHTSGYGQTGDPGYVSRPSSDSVIQAFGGMAVQNGMEPPNPPLDARPYMNDYQVALFTMGSALCAYIEMMNTGKGESVDLAAFEIAWKTQYSFPIEWIMDDVKKWRTGNTEPKGSMVGLSNYRCADDKYVFLALGGKTLLHKTLEVVGLADQPDYPDDMAYCLHGTPAGEHFFEVLTEYCLSKPAAEIEKEFGDRGIPCSMIYDVEGAAEHPHVQAREVFCEWEDPKHGTVKGVNVIPKVSQNPGEIWRGAPLLGMDNDDLLAELGYSQDEIASMYEAGVIKAEQA